MPKDLKKKEDVKSAGPTAPDASTKPQPQPSAPAAAKPAAAAQPQAPKPVEPPIPKVSFNRWFAAKKYKPHWRAGMAAFTDTSVRRTVVEWDKVFEQY